MKKKNYSSRGRLKLIETVRNLPQTSGVYLMKSKDEKVLYVGKASNLRRRVASYFKGSQISRINMLVLNTAGIEYLECENDELALILEAALIKEKKPYYNVALKDDKSYPYVEVTRETFPRIFIRRMRQETKNMLLGPYPKVGVLRSVMKLVRHIFPYCSCKAAPKRECLYCHLKLCPAPHAGKISVEDYRQNIKGIIRILKGEREELIGILEDKMDRLAIEHRFEEACVVREKLFAVRNLYRGHRFAHELLSLKDALNLPSIPLSIEAIDISALSGKEATGSVVVFRNGIADKSSYRRYRIKGVSSIDDYAMISEVVHRRYQRLKEEFKTLPDLVIIDGGLGHVQRAAQVLKELSLKIPIIGIAKRNEEIWFSDEPLPLVISRNNPVLQLLQRLRDEAHRFARKYHLLLRSKKIVERVKISP